MAASTSYNQNPSSSTSPPTQWDVFLSFRGEDTRNTFTGHLYKDLCRNGIKTFKDDPELLGGEVISRALPHAIHESKTYIVVLSENYASSSWCLDELVEILRCHKTMKRLVVPVFYYIDPYVVRHQIERFKEAFDKHQTRYDVEKVNNWRLTLKDVADFSGYNISKNRSQADIVDEVVERVLLEINPVTLNVAKYPVGLHSRVEGVTSLFNNDAEAVIKIGIHGMGGVGKTTLAKAVYNQNYQRFQGSCFLANVREVSRTKGVVCLQQQLIADVLKRNNITIANADQGIELIRDRICSKKVLIVIDDLDYPKPLDYLEGSFAVGSIVIITTRHESYKLFTRHAFGDETRSDTFLKLSKEILKRAGGLPLALQVFGSNLRSESEDGWRKFIDKLKRTPIDDVEENLMISFDALKSVDPFLQDIFLDIACFYLGWKKKKAAKAMEAYYTYVDHNIDILKKRSLITINDKDELGMHDLLRDMGRKIARNNSPDEPGKHSRLWVLEDIDTVLKNDKGTEAIQGIIFDYYNHFFEMEVVTFPAESFRRMSKLKFLLLNNVNLTGSFRQIFKELRWLCWKCFPLQCLPSDFYAEKLVILELPYSNMRTTPNFIRLPCLEILNLEFCTSLEEVHVSIGSLVHLIHLNLRKCTKLRSLPDSICGLRALEILNISFANLEKLPDQLGMITSLRKLNVKMATMLRMLPDICRLSNIKDLHLMGCYNLLSISELPTNLEWMGAKDCTSLKRLPDLSSLKHLKSLDFINCRCLQRLPNLSNLEQLEELKFRHCASLTEIMGLDKITSLKDLDFCYCGNLLSVSKLPPNLKRIYAEGCTSLKRLPNLSNLKQLESLDFTNCSGLTVIQGLEELTCLRELHLAECNSSFLARTLTKRFFEIMSGFGHKVEISIGQKEFRDWIGQPSKFGRYCLDLQPNESHNFLAIILAVEVESQYFEDSGVECSVNNFTSGFIWSDTLCDYLVGGSLIVIVPSSILSIRDGDDRIEITTDTDILCGIHLLYKTEIA